MVETGFDSHAHLDGAARIPAAAGEPGAAAVSRSRPIGPRWPVVFGASFVALATLLLVRNSVLFSLEINDGGDSASNSILALRAKHFDLLVGNYSRVGFHHPGPAFLYVHAFGEWLFHDVLGIVPSPWNGQMVAVLVLNALLVAITLTLLSQWLRSWPATVLAGAAMLGYFACYGDMIARTWMPLLYTAPFLLLLVAAASVAAGRVGHLWAVAFAGGLLVHGHAEFLSIAPAIATTAIAILVYRRRRDGRPAFGRDDRGALLLMLGVIGVFAFPIVLDLVLHWPGEFGKYLSYGASKRDGHSPVSTLGYVLVFWPGGYPVLRPVAAVALFAAAIWLTRRLPDGPRRSLLRTLTALVGLGTALFAAYAQFGIDHLSEIYVGLFSRVLPLLLTVVVVLSLGEAVSAAWRGRAAVAALVVAVAAASVTPTLITPHYDDVANLPRALELLADRAAGRPIVLELAGDLKAWPEMAGLLAAGKRTGRRVCASDPSWELVATAELVCTADEVQTGERSLVAVTGTVPQSPVPLVALAALGHATLWVRPASAAS